MNIWLSSSMTNDQICLKLELTFQNTNHNTHEEQVVFDLYLCLYLPHFAKTESTMFTWSVLIVSPQMPQVMDHSAQGIDLHFWGQVLNAFSEKIQVVSESTNRLPLLSRLLLLACSEEPVFLALQETCLFRCSLSEKRSEEQCWFSNAMGVITPCVLYKCWCAFVHACIHLCMCTECLI